MNNADIIAPENTGVRVSNMEFNPAANAHRLEEFKAPEMQLDESLKALRKAEALNLASAIEQGRDEDLVYRQLSPTEKFIYLEKYYIPRIKEAILNVDDAKQELDDFQSSELRFIANHATKSVHYDRTAEGYKRVQCYGINHYKGAILTDDDLMQNYYEVDRKQVGVAPGSGTQWIYYLPRGVKPADLELKAREQAAAAFVDERPKYVRAYEAAFVACEKLIKEYQRKEAEIETVKDVTALFSKLERPESRKRK